MTAKNLTQEDLELIVELLRKAAYDARGFAFMEQEFDNLINKIENE